MDTAIWTKPCGDLAGQLLYGDSMQRSHLVPTWTVTSFGAFLSAAVAVMFTPQLSCQMVLRFQLPAKRV